MASYSLTIQRTDLPWPRREYPVTARWVDHRTLDPLFLAWVGMCGRIGHPPAYTERVMALLPHRALRRDLERADAVWVVQPYPFGWVRRHTPAGVPVLLDAQNIEVDLVADATGWWRRRIAAEVARCEREAFGSAAMVFATSPDEAEVTTSMGASDVVVIPNGVDVERLTPATTMQRAEARRALGLPLGGAVVLFTGSNHPPNREAVEILERHAPRYAAAGVTVAIVGRCGIGRPHVPGIVHTGEVPDVLPFFRAADIAVCPLVSGSGTSLKSVEYLAAGLPLVSTAVGVRGLGLGAGDAVVCGPEDMPGEVAALVGDEARRRALAAAGRRVAESRFGWAALGERVSVALDRLVGTWNASSPRRGAPRARPRRPTAIRTSRPGPDPRPAVEPPPPDHAGGC